MNTEKNPKLGFDLHFKKKKKRAYGIKMEAFKQRV